MFPSLKEQEKHFQRYGIGLAVSSAMFSITTVCHRTSDTRHPLLMITNRDGNRYFFGKVPEGSQRLLNENSFKMSKVKSIFLTGIISLWSELGGMPGLFLTVSDAVTRGLDVYVSSSSLLKYIIATWRFFVFRRGCPLNVLTTENEKLVADSSTAFFPIPIAPQPTNTATNNIKDSVNGGDSTTMRRLDKLIGTMFPPEETNLEQEKASPENTFVGIQSYVKLPELDQVVSAVPQKSLNYIIRFLPTRGKFNPAKAKELGIKPGLDFKELTMGNLVVNSRGETVHSHQVLGESNTFPKVAIIDIPNNTYLSNTLSSPEWFDQSGDRGSEQFGLVYHFLGDDIDFRLSEYLEFIQKFPAECIHVVNHKSISDDTLSFKTSAIHLLKLKTFSAKNFNLPYMEQTTPCPGPFVKLQSLQTYKIDSSGVKDENSIPESVTWSSIFEEHVKPVLPNLVLNTEAVSLKPLDNAKSLKDNVQIVTLGTGSALPSIHRNVLSNLLRIPYVNPKTQQTEFRSILLDGGEGTFGMLLRNYGHNNCEQLKQILDEMCLIYLSHLHADHNLGIITVIREWLQHHADNERKLYLIIPWQYRDFLREWFQVENREFQADLSRICFISCEEFMQKKTAEPATLDFETFERWMENTSERKRLPKTSLLSLSKDKWSELQNDTNLSEIQTCAAIHCNWAYSVCMTFKLDEHETFRVSFSGDTRPNPKFVDIGLGSDILIHEASLDDVNIEEAISKKHTTLTEAVRISQLMRCKKLLLTHFSTRFSEKPNFFMNAEEYNDAAEKLKVYLGPRSGNIFAREDADLPKFEEMELCYAYDFMSVRLNEMDFQRPHFAAINALSVDANSDVQSKKDEKEERKQMRQFEKRNTKRQQRLAAGQ